MNAAFNTNLRLAYNRQHRKRVAERRAQQQRIMAATKTALREMDRYVGEALRKEMLSKVELRPHDPNLDKIADIATATRSKAPKPSLWDRFWAWFVGPIV